MKALIRLNKDHKYSVSIDGSGRKSRAVGDELSKLLECMSVEKILALAEDVLDQPLQEKYSHLNNGMKVMAVRNKIRGSIKRHEIRLDDVRQWISDNEHL